MRRHRLWCYVCTEISKLRVVAVRRSIRGAAPVFGSTHAPRAACVSPSWARGAISTALLFAGGIREIDHLREQGYPERRSHTSVRLEYLPPYDVYEPSLRLLHLVAGGCGYEPVARTRHSSEGHCSGHSLMATFCPPSGVHQLAPCPR
ncbi:hypothetical protein EVAR_102922_1 [Eumeta japonica]|uniref:Uncharacterized protein n=1 Tax=Eumeta variegata TaxID=151549 RepID=A0A4C2A5K7_EUMVA|nr:hypothetical protein EVAR_102922_1 [Eumeta japonica]